MIVIDATNLVAGRLATYVAKKALLGEEVVIVNSERTIIRGKPNLIIEKYRNLINRGNTFKGPFVSRRPDFLLKRIIRGMLPIKKVRGRDAFKRIKCFIGVPEEYQNKSLLSPEEAKPKTDFIKSITILELSKHLGWNPKFFEMNKEV